MPPVRVSRRNTEGKKCFSPSRLKHIRPGGDSKPTAAAYVVLRELSAELDKHLIALDRVVKVDIARFNGRAAAWNVKPIEATPHSTTGS